MAYQNSSGSHGPKKPDMEVPESSNPQATLDGAKKKKKSRKSKSKEALPSVIHTNGAVSSPHRVEEQPRPSKRKRDSEPDDKKKKKKKKEKRQAAEDIVNEADAPTGTTPENKDRPVDRLPEHPDKEDSEPASNGVAKTTPTIPSSEPEATPSSEPNNNLTLSGRPRKIRGSRIGGKNNLKVGFFVEAETQKLEKYKVDFCNRNGFNHNPKIFDAMVQHSERDSGEWPCPTDICRKPEFWAEIYAILPDRDRRSVYRFMRRHFQDSTQKPHEWTAEQDEELVRLRAEHGPKYALIAKLLGRSDDDVTQRWKNRLEFRGTQKRGAWTEAEMRSLISIVQDIWNIEHTIRPELAGKDIYGMSERIILWGNVSTAMNHVRSRQQCADRWRKIVRHVSMLRKTVDPDAVFDPVAATRRKQRNDVKKSDDHVEDDDNEEEAEESIAPDSTPGMTPKLGFTDHQQLLSLGSSSLKEKPADISFSEPDAKPHFESQPESEDEINEASFVTATDEPAPPSVASHPTRQHTSNNTKQSKDETNKASKSSKKRKRSETERPADEPEPKVGVETPSTTTTDADKKARKAAKKEKKRLKKEKREREEREERERQEAEAAAAAAKQAKKDRKKEKKEKKEREEREQEEKKTKSKKSIDAVETNGIDATSTAASSHKKRKTKHRESIPRPNGTDIKGNESVKSPKKSKKNKRKSRGESSNHESPAAEAHRSNAESDDGGGNESSDYDVKIEGDDSD